MSNKNELFFKDKPLFGFDIGFGSLKVMQVGPKSGKKQSVLGYGATTFDHKAIVNGVIVDPETVAKAAHELFKDNIIGNIGTRRVVLSIPVSRSYNRNVQLPKLSNKELKDAIRAEAEQYIPVPVDDLYIDFVPLRQTKEGIDYIIVAVPKHIVDSYIDLVRVLDLEVVGIETTIAASARLFLQAENSDVPTVLIDFGSLSADLTLYDKGLVVTSTIPGGGDNFTQSIATALGVTQQEAHIIKTKYGLGVSKKQKQIHAGLKPILDSLGKEIRRMIRYYDERSGSEQKIGQVVTMGGGANMPGLSEYLTNTLRLPVRMCDPWQNLNFSHLQPPNRAEKSMYVTVAGLSLTAPKELWQ